MDTKDAHITQLENTIKNLEQQVSNLTEMILLMRKKKFGSSSEKTPNIEVGVQLNIFNEAEADASSDAQEPVVKLVDGYYRKNQKTKR
jgi:transposase